jgi:hypothetical protein
LRQGKLPIWFTPGSGSRPKSDQVGAIEAANLIVAKMTIWLAIGMFLYSSQFIDEQSQRLFLMVASSPNANFHGRQLTTW